MFAYQLPTDFAFATGGAGIKNGQVMKLISKVYNKMTVEERAALLTSPASVDDINHGEEVPVTDQHPPNV